MTRILALILAVLVGVPAYADSPIIWFGQYAKSLTSKGLALQSGALINNDGALNYAPQKANKWTAESNVTVADDTTAADLARANTTGTGVKFTATGAGDAYFCFTLDTADYNKKLAVQWDQNATAGVASTYVAGDYQLDVYSSTSSTCASGTTRLALSTDSSALSPIPALSGTYRTTFDSPGSAAQYVKVQVTRVNNSHSLVISNLYVGPGTVTQGAAVSEWQSYTPTVANFTGTVTGKWRRVGDSMQVRIYAASTTTVAGTLTIPVPTGYTIDSSKVAFSGGSYGVLGVAQAVDLGNAFYYGSVAYSTTTAVGILNIATGGGAQVDVWKASVPFTWGNTDTLSADFTVPIAEWAGSGTVNVVQNDLTYYSAATNSAGNWVANATLTAIQGPGGSLCGTNTVAGVSSQYTITPAYPIPVGTKPVMELSGDGIHWSPAPINNSAIIIEGLRFDGTNYFGAGVGLNATGQIIVTFGKYVGGATTAWSTANPSYWRVSVAAPGQAVGFSAATSTASGLVSYEDSGTFAATFTGARTTASKTITYSRVGKQVTLYWGSDVGASCSANTLSASAAVPTGLRPTTAAMVIPMFVQNNAADQDAPGTVTITTGGNMTFSRSNSVANFTNAANCGFYSGTATYPVN